MRTLLIPALILMGACAQEPPTAPLVQDVAMMDVFYVCSTDGVYYMVAKTDEGVEEILETQGYCDYHAWREDVRRHGPLRQRNVPWMRDEWLAQRINETDATETP